eukprot:TRINITY_DN2192_c0_g1_i10.p1 TRINITY_DN2192_c0_g1~~TRINITY_DN2192_c0_g1_i10.p1  ORF type:complete len:349 (-),score=49.94 TRINITY_DN2192_c0_g1_i10:1654-2700(-)
MLRLTCIVLLAVSFVNCNSQSLQGEETLVYYSEDSLSVPKEVFKYESEDDKNNLMYIIRTNYNESKVSVYSVREKNNTQNMVLSTSGFDPVEEQTKRRRSLQQQQPIFEKVFGVDEREKVTSHMQYPYSAVGWIAFLDEFGYASAGCTGTLVSQRVVLTAAHCLYVQSDKATTEFPEGMSAGGYEFYAGRSGNIHLPVAKAIDAVVTRKYAELNDEYDYAVLVLDRDVGSETGWMGIGVNCEDGQKPISVNIAGYPYDKSENNDVMYKSSCDNVVIDQCANVTGFFSYLCDTEKGMSGAPVWVHYENVQKREIRGIHVVGRRQLNQGVYISPKTFNFITKEINASTYL